MLGDSDQVTAALVVPVTVAVNCWVWEVNSELLAGVMLTAMTGCKVMVAVADLVESAALVR